MSNTITQLRELLRPAVGSMKDLCTNVLMPDFCAGIGLPVPPEEGDKRSRLHAAFDALPDTEIITFANGLVNRREITGNLRDQVQDVLWAQLPVVDIPKRTRREIARALNSVQLFQHWPSFQQVLEDVFVIPTDFSSIFGLGGQGVLEFAHRHFVRNPEDANVEQLFEQLQAFDLPTRRFCLLLVKLTSGDVQVDVEAQEALVAALNPVLLGCGAELRQIGMEDGYPTFDLALLRSPRGRPKNIIFASPRKPDIRFRDAIENDIEIVSNTDDVLAYDRTVTPEGLRWTDLQRWWMETTSQTDEDAAKRSLYRRLCKSLPSSSPPQQTFFKSYFTAFKAAIPQLPALLPEVWLHWDPKTVKQRGARALLNHRMDFLMLMPGGVRVVMEIDGMQHYADSSGKADPQQYARMAAGDRELRLSGYEVYRFGGAELCSPNAQQLVQGFFLSLFERHGVTRP